MFWNGITYMDYHDKKRKKAIIDELKILVALLSAEASNIFLAATLPERTAEEIELDQIKRYMVLLIRATIVIFSINNDWPLAMCVTISLIISVAIIIVRIGESTGDED